MAQHFRMMPQQAAERLTEAGQRRSVALSAGAPSFAADQYSSGFVAAVSAMWAAHSAELAANVTTGFGLTPGSATTPETAEAVNATATST